MLLFIKLFSALFSVINPFGTIPIFLSLTQGREEKRQSIALKTSLFMLGILVIFYLLGHYVMGFLGIGLESLRIAGGIIIVISGYALITGKFDKHKGMNRKLKLEAQEKDDISFTPLAMPMLAGPGSISFLIGENEAQSSWYDQAMMVLAIIAVCLLTFLLLRLSGHIQKILGASGLVALSRIMGFLVMCIGIQSILNGITSLVQSFHLQ